MKKNVIISLGAICFIVILVVTVFGVGAYQQTPKDQKEENTGEIELPVESQKEIELENTEIIEQPNVFPVKQDCSGDARCISGFVTRIVDGDTIHVDGQSIRFALVNTPEYGQYDYTQARSFIENICPVGSKVLVDEDDGQTEGSYDRIIGVIYCNNLNLNEEILEVGHAEILASFCSKSEFSNEPWAQKFGC